MWPCSHFFNFTKFSFFFVNQGKYFLSERNIYPDLFTLHYYTDALSNYYTFLLPYSVFIVHVKSMGKRKSVAFISQKPNGFILRKKINFNGVKKRFFLKFFPRFYNFLKFWKSPHQNRFIIFLRYVCRTFWELKI